MCLANKSTLVAPRGWSAPGGLPITRPVSATRTRPRSVIPSSTLVPTDTTPSVVVHERGEDRIRREEQVQRVSSSTAGDRIMFRYLDDANARFEITESHPWRARANRPDFAPMVDLFRLFCPRCELEIGNRRGGERERAFHQVSDFQRFRESGTRAR